jgi:hypothetical protein
VCLQPPPLPLPPSPNSCRQPFKRAHDEVMLMMEMQAKDVHPAELPKVREVQELFKIRLGALRAMRACPFPASDAFTQPFGHDPRCGGRVLVVVCCVRMRGVVGRREGSPRAERRVSRKFG